MESKSFTDFDAFADSVRDVDADMMFQNPTVRTWSIKHTYLPQVHVQVGRLGTGNIVEGQSRSDGYLLYLPLTEACEYSVNGTAVKRGSLMILEPGCDFCIATKYEHDWCSIFVPSDRVAGGDEQCSTTMACRVSPQDFRTANQFRILLDQITTTATEHPKFESSTAATHVEVEVVNVAREILRLCQKGQPHQRGRPRVRRDEIVRRCKQLLTKREGSVVGVEELATVANVSQRTLRNAFQDYYGVSPIQYLAARRLHQIHRSLKAAEPEELTVTDLLFRHGVWDVGRFAARYRRLFGELPSETLRR